MPSVQTVEKLDRTCEIKIFSSKLLQFGVLFVTLQKIFFDTVYRALFKS